MNKLDIVISYVSNVSDSVLRLFGDVEYFEDYDYKILRDRADNEEFYFPFLDINKLFENDSTI